MGLVVDTVVAVADNDAPLAVVHRRDHRRGQYMTEFGHVGAADFPHHVAGTEGRRRVGDV